MAVSIEVDGVRISDGVLHTFFFSTDGFTTLLADSPANTYFEPRIKKVPVLARAMFDNVSTYGASRSAIGDVEMVNSDGGLDYLITDYAFDGQQIRVKTGDWSNPYGSWEQTLTGVLSNIRTDKNSLFFVFRDPLADLDKWDRPLFKGDNALPMGLEGTSNDLKGQVKPRVYGSVLNASPKLVNTSKLIYQISDKPCAVTQVRDMGVLLMRGADYSSSDEMQEVHPAPGQYRCFDGYFRLGANPAGTITCYAETTNLSPDSLINQIALDSGIQADFIANDELPSVQVGVYADADASARSLMDSIATSVGAWYGFDRWQKLRFGRLENPSGEVQCAWLADSIMNLNVRSITPPVWKVTVRYARNYTTQENLQTLVWGTDHAGWVAEQYRSAVAQDESIRTIWRNADDVTIDTVLISLSDAQAEAERVLALRRVSRITIELELPISELGGVDLGSIVQLDVGRFGLAGKKLMVIGMDSSVAKTKTKVILWG